MSIWQDLIDLYVKGGMEVVTAPEVGGEVGDRPVLIRTVILPDADIVTWINPAAPDAALWAQHQQNLAAKIRAFHLLRWWLKWGGVVIIFGLFTIYNAMTSQLTSLVISLIISIAAGFAVRFATAMALRWYIQKQVDKYLAPLLTLL